MQTVDADPQIFLDLCTGSGFITYKKLWMWTGANLIHSISLARVLFFDDC